MQINRQKRIDNNKMDENFLQQQIHQWVQENINHVSPEKSISMHIDRLEGVDLAKESIIQTSLEIFKSLVKEVQLFNNSVKVMLVFPLKAYNRKISTKHPVDLESLQRQLLIMRPPEICLVSWTSPRKFGRWEEYSCPIDFLPLSDYHDNLYARYKENRGRRSIENDWEFGKWIYIEHYPDGVFDY